MTESDWLECTDPQPMLDFLRGKASDRKLRLFAVACCRSIMHLLTDNHISRKTIEFAERFADEQATKNDLHGKAWGQPGMAFTVVHRQATVAAQESASYAAGMVEQAARSLEPETCEAWTNAFSEAWPKYHLGEARQIADASMPTDWVNRGRSAKKEEEQRQLAFLRDIFGNPFCPITFNPAWLTPAVKALAQTIYDDRAFDQMPLLADALEKAGCAVPEILDHCRGPGVHVRGCWVIDLLLGKE
jgi:hypothetical protein